MSGESLTEVVVSEPLLSSGTEIAEDDDDDEATMTAVHNQSQIIELL